jgi:FHA domain
MSVPDIRYGVTRDSRWVAMVAPACVLVVDAAVDSERQAGLWRAVRVAVGVQSVLDALTTGGISSTPDFALLILPPEIGQSPVDVPVILRGELAVSMRTSDASIELSGAGVSTWVERVVADVISIQIGLRPASTGSSSPLPEFVLNFGSSAIDWLLIGAVVDVDSIRSAPAIADTAPVAAVPEPRRLEAPIDPGVTISDPTIAAPQNDDGREGGYDFLFGETVVRTVEGAAVRDEPGSAPGDHDGRTAVGLNADERRAARQARKQGTAPPVPDAPVFVLEFVTGEREALDRTLVIGRAPSASQVSASSVPRLVTVGGPDQDISRNHVQVSVEGGTVLVTDLHSRNGTMVTLPGRPPQQLRGGQPTAVLSGSVVDLGSGVSFTVGES